jgi:hypothetical protein
MEIARDTEMVREMYIKMVGDGDSFRKMKIEKKAM